MSRLSMALLLGSVFTAPAAEISGRVMDAQTGEPVARARVKVWFPPSGGQSVELAIVTDAAGNFAVRNLPEGHCYFMAEKQGYLASQMTEPARSIVSAVDPKPTSVVIRMTRQAVIEGSVVDEKGAGVPLASIQLIKQMIVEGRRQFRNVSGAQTDETGYFRAFRLEAGRYYLAVAAQPRSKALAYPPVFYPGAAGIQSAQPIDLQPGREEKVEIRLRAVAAHAIRGRVTPAGQFVGFTLRPKDAGLFSIELNVGTGTYWDAKTGIFKISGAPSGVYVLEASTFSDVQQRHNASTTVVVGDKDVEGIVLSPVSPPPLAGRVKIDGPETPRAGSQIIMFSPHRQFNSPIDAEGNFRFNDLPADTYHVIPQLGGSLYVQSIRQGSRGMSADRLVTIGDAAPEPIEIVLSPHGATVEGTAPLPDGDSPAIHVVLLRHAGEGMILEREAYASAGPTAVQDTRARFSMQGVAPGEYVLFAWPQGSQIEYTNPETMRQYDALGKPVSISEGARLSVIVDRLLPKVEH